MTPQARVDEYGVDLSDPSHLTQDATKVDATMPAEKDREWYCLDCQVRITRSPGGGSEYGHKESCEHHISTQEEYDANDAA